MRSIRFLVWVGAAGALWSQQAIAPTPEPVGSPRGENLGGYNVVNSFETGYRFSRIDGDLGRYRSDVNYRNGVRLLGSNLTVNSRDGHGRFFDEIVLSTLGLGNDPYQSSLLRVQKNRLYRYDMLWRLNEYYNPGLTIAGGLHALDTRRRLQDHDFVLGPESNWSLRLGYSRESQTGPALSSVQLFDGRGDIFPVFRDIRRTRNEYRAGGRMQWFGFRLDVLRAWDNFKEDTPDSLDGAGSAGRTALSGFRRAEPYHGNTPLWRVNLHRESKVWAMNGRFSYAGGRRDFVLDEMALGTDRFGAARNRQIVVAGNARRPVATGDFLLSFTPGDKFSLVNNTSVYNNRIDGNAAYLEFDNARASANLAYFQFLGMRVVSNSTEAGYRVTKWLGFRGGYQYSARRVSSVEATAPEGAGLQALRYTQESHLHSGVAGIRLQPLRPLTINLDGEVGRDDRPFFPVSDKNYHLLGGRIRYKTRSVALETSYRQRYNTNSVALSTHSARGRDYTAAASWMPRGWFGFDASYARLHVDTVSGIAYFSRLQLTPGQSVYISNLHTGNLGMHFGLGRADVYAGYSIVEDTGDGGRAGVFDPQAVLAGAPQAYPLRFHTPLARLSIRLHPKIRWNAGWQFYRYREDIALSGAFQNYRAHTGYSSVLWSF